jgi:hypothetical protein
MSDKRMSYKDWTDAELANEYRKQKAIDQRSTTLDADALRACMSIFAELESRGYLPPFDGIGD